MSQSDLSRSYVLRVLDERIEGARMEYNRTVGLPGFDHAVFLAALTAYLNIRAHFYALYPEEVE